MSKNTLMILLAAVILNSAANAQSLWPTDPTQSLPICTLPGSDTSPQSHTFANGNIFIVWYGSDEKVLYQVLNQNGNNLLPYNGVNINQDNYANFMFHLVPADTNSVIIIYSDGRTGIPNDYNIYAQKINTFGERLWGPNGILICDIGHLHLVTADAVSDSVGGAFAQISGYTPEFGYAYMQHIDSSGNLVWGQNGVLMREGQGYAGGAGIVPDLQGGVISVWEDYPDQAAGPHDRKQHIDAQGNLLWGMYGVPFLYQSGLQAMSGVQDALSDGEGGGIWMFQSGTESYLILERMDADGHVFWEYRGEYICRSDEKMLYNPYDNHYWIFNDENIPFQDGNPYLYRFDVNGNFSIERLMLGEVGYNHWEVNMGIYKHGIIAAYDNWRQQSYNDLLCAQKVDTNAQLLWGGQTGVLIATNNPPQWATSQTNYVTQDEFDGAIVVSHKTLVLNPQNNNIYARRVLTNGTLGGLPEIELTIVISDSDIILNWNNINIAEYYNIYISDDAYNFSSLPDTTVTDTTFMDVNAVTGGNRFYKVTFGN